MGSCGPTTRTCLRWQATPCGPGAELGKQGAVGFQAPLLLSARWHTEPDCSCHPYPGSHRPQCTVVFAHSPLEDVLPLHSPWRWRDRRRSCGLSDLTGLPGILLTLVPRSSLRCGLL